ncbi:hypothetical protein HZA97_04065 [Candidatus Woesearchaeota archaeon]|nr:hypothetical protein [Candidatus Woesearchaeota archaeon]
MKKECKIEFKNSKMKIYYSCKAEKAIAMGGLGSLVGALLGAGATVYAGYEIGTAVNNYVGLTNTLGRGVIDLIAMGVAAGPCMGIGFYGGMGLGAIVGAATYKEPTRKK